MADYESRTARIRNRVRFWVLSAVLSAAVMVASTGAVLAHALGEGVVFLSIQKDTIEGHVDFPLTDVNDIVFAGEVNDGILTPEELDQRIGRLKDYIAERVSIAMPEGALTFRFTGHEVVEPPKVPFGFVQVFFSVDTLPAVPSVLEIRYSALFDVSPLHRGLLVIDRNALTGYQNDTEAVSLIFTEGSQVQELDLAGQSGWDLFGDYVGHGIFHIGIGFDHILFLIALLLTAVFEWKDGKRVACQSFRKAFYNVVAIVTLFTLAHSITLTLAVLDIVTLPSRFVEAVIALTVIAAAVHNLYPILGNKARLIVFVFGLFHGFGFAGVLTDLGFQSSALFTTLFGFNIGVEIGQIMIVSLVFPLLYWARNSDGYARFGVGGGSLAIAGFGGFWILDRTLGLPF